MTTDEAIKMIKADGWREQKPRKATSHRSYIHPVKKGKVTISYHRGSDEIHPKTLQSIKRQAGLI